MKIYFKNNLKKFENFGILNFSGKNQCIKKNLNYKYIFNLDLNVRTKFLNVSKKNFGAKYKTIVKNLEIDSDSKSENLNPSNITTPNKTKISNYDKENLQFKNSEITKENPEKIFMIDLRNSIINLDESRPNRFAILLTVHSLPSLLFFQSLYSIMWVYQIFWIGTSIGFNLSSYEFYSDEKEQKILKRHLNFCLLISAITILIGIFALQKEEVSIFLTILNFGLIYLTFSRKKFEFFIPSWIKYSFRKFFPLMSILYLVSISMTFQKREIDLNKKNLKTSNEDVLTLYYRYVREMSRIISEMQNENPNVEYIKNQLKEGEINLESNKRTRFENFTKYF